MARTPISVVLAACVGLLAARQAEATDVRGTVQLSLNGHARSNASGVVVFVADQPLKTGAKATEVMAQAEMQFDPQTLVVPVGSQVSFPNRDSVEHNVFSNSPHATFDLGRYGRGAGKSRIFDQPGVVDVYCNVHRQMIGHVVVVPGPWAISAADGSFVITGVTPGHHELVIWDRLGAPAVSRQSLEVPATGEASVRIAIVEAGNQEPPHADKFGSRYGETNY